MSPLQILKEFFGFSDFRTGQEEIIDAILKEKNVLAVMPTGSGKSLCFQIPALIKESFSIVISPLISLMKDQVETLNKISRSSAFINSSLDYSKAQKVLWEIQNREINLLYLSPEKLVNHEFISKIRNLNPYFLFVDEAHCISQWGHSFRPSYRNIKAFAEEVGVKSISAFTATATPEVRDDIISELGFNDPKVFVYGFERDNLSLNVLHEKDKKGKVLDLIRESSGSVIIYTATRKNSEQLAQFLRQKNIRSEYYHAGLKTELRKIIQDDFINNNFKVIVATNAFGMGIDKKNIELVIHYNIPGSIENLYQEFGRAGRDGRDAKSYLFFTEKDKLIQEYLITLSNPSVEQIRICYDAILDYHRIALNTKANQKLMIDEGLEKLLNSKSLNQTLLTSILNTLEISGYLRQISGRQYFSEFQFLLSKEKLKNYLKKLENDELRELILILIQYYGSAPFSRPVKLNYGELINLVGSNKGSIKSNLEKLNSIGIIDHNLPSKYTEIEMIRERVPSKDLKLNTQEIKLKLNRANQKLNSVISYSFSERCRFEFILDFFGENTKDYSCGKCDNCSNKNTLDIGANEYIKEIIIKTLKEFKGGLASPRLIGIIKGKSKSQVAKSLSTYESCLHYSVDEIEKSLQALISKKLLKDFNGKLFWDPVSDLIESENLETSSNEVEYESNLELFNKLREERNLASKKFSQHPNIICSDDLLKKITLSQPKTPASFLSIDKVNQRMFNKIGLEFIEIINEHCKSVDQNENKDELPKHISQTYRLFKKGYSLEEISNLLKLPQSIVSIQLETIIQYFPNEDYRILISESDYNLIIDAIEKNGENDKAVKGGLPNSINYAKIRIVRAMLSVSRPFPGL